LVPNWCHNRPRESNRYFKSTPHGANRQEF